VPARTDRKENLVSRPPARPNPNEFSSEERELYDEAIRRVAGWGGSEPTSDFEPNPYFSVLLNSPLITARQTAMGSAVRSIGNRGDSYSHADREWVDQVLSYGFDYYGVLALHTPDAIAVGVRLEAIEALRDGREEDLSEDERLLTEYIRQVINGRVTTESYDRIEARLGRRGAVEYTYFIAYLLMVIRLHMAFGVPSPTREDIDVLLKGLRDGTSEVDPTWKSRLG
jgi:hypothetical protein